MCELLGLSFNREVHCSLSFRGFRHGGDNKPHGWGVARFSGNACQVFKEPINANHSRLAEFLRDYEQFASKIFIGHVRYRSVGEPSLENTHPFVRVFRRREVALAHNGTLMGDLPRNELRFRPVGDTDSEWLLCALLTELSAERIAFTDFPRIEVLLSRFNGQGRMNLLFSEGEHLYAYRDGSGYRNGLCMVQRAAPFDGVSLQDEDWHIDLASEKDPSERGVVIATRPLTDEPWTDLRSGALYVFRDGELVYGA